MMEITHNTSGDTTDSGSPEDLAVEPAFMLLFAIHLPHLFTGFTMPFADIEPLHGEERVDHVPAVDVRRHERPGVVADRAAAL